VPAALADVRSTPAGIFRFTHLQGVANPMTLYRAFRASWPGSHRGRRTV